MIRAWHTRFW